MICYNACQYNVMFFCQHKVIIIQLVSLSQIRKYAVRAITTLYVFAVPHKSLRGLGEDPASLHQTPLFLVSPLLLIFLTPSLPNLLPAHPPMRTHPSRQRRTLLITRSGMSMGVSSGSWGGEWRQYFDQTLPAMHRWSCIPKTAGPHLTAWHLHTLSSH